MKRRHTTANLGLEVRFAMVSEPSEVPPPMTPSLYCLEPPDLERFLQRGTLPFLSEMNLGENLAEVLRKANEFVPSDAGSILLDDPREQSSKNTGKLTFIAAFGEHADSLVGRQIQVTEGIAGHVYTSGRAHHATNPEQDRFFHKSIDTELDHTTRSIVAIPIRIGANVCGVLELINRREAEAYSDHDRNLLEIFADYISVSVQNVLDGRQAQEIAKRDNLTDLYNDRYLHIALEEAIHDQQRSAGDLALLFLDLDYFKYVNDSHGHLAGSQVLQEVGHLLHEMVPDASGITARYGGDEFVLALLGADLVAAVDVAESIRSRIETHTFCTTTGSIHPEPLHLRGITCSIGVATLRRHLTPELSLGDAKSTLLHLADSAMYVAKDTGRNRTAVAGELVPRRGIGSPEPVIDRR